MGEILKHNPKLSALCVTQTEVKYISRVVLIFSYIHIHTLWGKWTKQIWTFGYGKFWDLHVKSVKSWPHVIIPIYTYFKSDHTKDIFWVLAFLPITDTEIIAKLLLGVIELCKEDETCLARFSKLANSEHIVLSDLRPHILMHNDRLEIFCLCQHYLYQWFSHWEVGTGEGGSCQLLNYEVHKYEKYS